MNAAATENYRARLRTVLEYIDAHLDDNLSVEQLSSIAAFSKYHFHRQFTELFGMGVYRYVQLQRLKRASYQLAFRDQQPVIEIALTSGYEGPEAFARAFKKTVGQSPSEFRKQPLWAPWYASFQPLGALRIKHMNTAYRIDQVRIIDFNEIKIAALEHRGDPKLIGDSIRKFIEWRKLHQLSPRVSDTFNILYDDPFDTEPEKFRLDICVSTERELAAPALGIVSKIIPNGRCATLRHIGSDDTFGAALSFLYSEWLPQSGEELRDFPLYCQRVSFFPDVPEHKAVTDVFLPLK